jgi:NhaP-type Na+/H+ or K+/H+ antiporter
MMMVARLAACLAVLRTATAQCTVAGVTDPTRGDFATPAACANGETVTEENVAEACLVECDEGYGDIAAATCVGTTFVPPGAGCESLTCATYEGEAYEVEDERDLRGPAFDVRGVSCGPGHELIDENEPADALVCTEQGGPYILTGCTFTACTGEGCTQEAEGEHGTRHGGEDTEHGFDVHYGGHLSAHMANKPCVPVICDEDLYHHDPLDAQGCQNYTIFNFLKNETDDIVMTCQGCVPHICDFGDHECIPVSCEIDGEIEGGHSFDPCAQGHHGGDGLAWWPFLLVCLLLTVCVTSCLKSMGNGACCGKSLNPPFTVVMFFLGYVLSSLASGESEFASVLIEESNGLLHASEVFWESIRVWKGAHPHIILFVLLPPLLFEDSSGMDYYVFRKVLMSSILLAGPGVGITMAACAGTTMLLFGFANECVVEEDHITHAKFVVGTEELEECIDFEGDHPPIMCTQCGAESPTTDQLPVSVHLLLGGMLAATDPVAVCAVLNDLGCPDKLNFMIAGESLLNDGTAVVAFMVMQSVVGGCPTDAAGVMISLVRLAGGGVLFGLAMSSIAFNYIKHLRNPNIEITTLVVCTLSTFWLAENVLGVSGVLGTVVFGVQTARTSFLAMDEHTHHANHAFWGEVGYVATSIIFILAGVKSRDKIARFIDEAAGGVVDLHTTVEVACEALTTETACKEDALCVWSGVGSICNANTTDEEFNVGNQMFMCVLLWFILTFIRAGTIFILSPILRSIGYGLTVKEAVVMVWGGLRGAVSLALALLIDGNHKIGDRARELIFLQTAGIVTMTLIVNGTTSGMVYKWLAVYPPNPFRPVLATQGLRNLQLEMDKFIKGLDAHWFHQNADNELVQKMFPNFSESHIYDGDLVDVKANSMHGAWVETISKGALVSPQRVGINAMNALKSGAQVGMNMLRVGYSAKEGMDEDLDATQPDSYAEIGLRKGDTYQTFETGVIACNANPSWSEDNSTKYFVPDGPDGTTLYLHMFENDIGESDAYLGQAKLELDELIDAGGTAEQTIELTTCTHNMKLREYSGTFPTQVSGSVTIRVECNAPTVQVTLLSGADLGDVKTEDLHQHGDHDKSGHEHAHGHGHGGAHALLLKNVKRWIEESNESVDSSHAMYEILLTNIKSGFIHERESKIISVRSWNKLNAALGIAYDMNSKDMENDMKFEKLKMAGSMSGERLAKMAVADPENFATPVDALVNYVIDYAENGLPFGGKFTPTVWFEHRLTIAEMFLATLSALKDLADADTSELGDEFNATITNCTDRARTALFAYQAEAPSTFKAVHSLIAFKVVAAEFHHRVHMYQDQGFFQDNLVSAVELAMDDREQELDQYVHMDYVWVMFGFCSAFKCLQDHPVVCVFQNDKDGIKNSYAAKQSKEAASVFEKNETSNPVAEGKSQDQDDT